MTRAKPGLESGGLKKGLKGLKGAQKDQKVGKCVPMIRKMCPKSRIIGKVLSRFFLVQALGMYTMTA